jgi:hypothetical protein
MKILLAGLGAVAVLVVTVVAIGAMLPVGHRAAREAVYPAPRDSVFALITGIERFPEWRTGVQRVERQPSDSGAIRYVEFGDDGAIPYEVVESVSGRRHVTRIAGEGLPFGGTWTFELADAPAGTRLRITEDGEVYNPLFRFASRFILGHHHTIERFLADLREVTDG